ncbi:MAG TPA: hypothetical protein VHB50_14165, partial [Bryobacteraceae bacterium]|nr:hypothetical protein [Bryobacteraceae bacterium]
WEPIRRFFLETKPGIVDVRTLEGQWKMQKFFWDDLTHRLDRTDEKAVQAVIVLSGPAFFENQEPVDPPAIGNDPDRRLFYIRYRAIPIDRRQRIRPHPGMRPLLPRPGEPLIPAMGMDDLERMVGPLHARLFDAASAEQFRRVLAAVIEQLQTY